MTGHQYITQVLSDNEFDEKDRPAIEDRRNKIQQAIEKEFGSKIQTIKYSGSISKATATKTSHDIDIAIHFKRDAFETLKGMFDATYDLLKRHYKTARQQRVSIGLPGQNVDVVPGRRVNPDDTSDNDVFLYVTDNDGRIKTNIEKQKSAVTASGVRDVIKVIKIWRDRWDRKFKSFALELLVMKALKTFDGKGMDNKVREVLEYIKDNIASCVLEDPGNSNNDVAESIGKADKAILKATARECLGYLDEADPDDEDDMENAWRKVFKDEPVKSGTKKSSRVVFPTKDYRSQPDRRHGF